MRGLVILGPVHMLYWYWEIGMSLFCQLALRVVLSYGQGISIVVINVVYHQLTAIVIRDAQIGH